jgi:hypothetical protein
MNIEEVKSKLLNSTYRGLWLWGAGAQPTPQDTARALALNLCVEVKYSTASFLGGRIFKKSDIVTQLKEVAGLPYSKGQVLAFYGTPPAPAVLELSKMLDNVNGAHYEWYDEVASRDWRFTVVIDTMYPTSIEMLADQQSKQKWSWELGMSKEVLADYFRQASQEFMHAVVDPDTRDMKLIAPEEL